MPISPLTNADDIITSSILVDGTKIPDVYLVSEIQVQKHINRIPSARIVLIDGSAPLETFEISETDTFVPGKAVEIKAGYRDEEATLFKGIVVKHGIKVRRGAASFLVVTCLDQAAKLTLGRKSTAFFKQKDSAVIEQLIGDAGLTADVDATSEEHPEIVRYYATAWDFIVSRAEANGLLVMVDDGTVAVKAPDASGEAALEIRYGDALQDLDAEIDARTQLPSVTCSAWDFSAQAVASGDSEEPSLALQGNLTGADLAEALGLAADQMQTSSALPAEQLTTWAKARLLKSRLARVRGTVSFQGNATPKPGQVVELAGLGARFNGKAFISGVTQRIEQGRWVTELEFGLAPRTFSEERRDIEAPTAAGLLPGIHGLHLGKVKKIDEDPDGQTRIQVDLPLIGSDGDGGIWARYASGYATGDAGLFFLPEVGDEVVVGFVNGDPRFPLVLGNLYSSQKAPPFTPDADNTHKAIVTKGQVKIDIDDAKKIITIETPGGHSVTLDDDGTAVTIQDSNGNKIELTSSGITLDSASDLTLKAAGNVKIEAAAAGSVKAGTDLSLQGLNVSAKADASFSAKGQASAELSASGQAKVSGAIVMIN
jgi:Rhs element Vgr protein